jgi:hypothetical protein
MPTITIREYDSPKRDVLGSDIVEVSCRDHVYRTCRVGLDTFIAAHESVS